jgi:uncharacterized protein YuzE
MLSFIEVDRDHDLAYILLRPELRDRSAVVARSARVADDVVLDLDANGRLIGIELLRASSHLDLDRVAQGPSDLIVGVREAAEMLGVERSNFVRDYANKPDFPAVIAELASGRFWLRPAIERYIEERHAGGTRRLGHQEYPRIKKGKLISAVKGNTGPGNMDQLLANSYMSRHVAAKPEYWAKLVEMLYGQGRLRNYAGAVEDIVDKLSFLMLAKDQIIAYEGTESSTKRFFVKYFAYTYVFVAGALLDSLAVFTNQLYALGFAGGDITFRKIKYCGALRMRAPELGERIVRKRNWIDDVFKYRDSLIHRHGIPVSPLPHIPENVTDAVQIDRYILRAPHYMPKDPNTIDDSIIDGKDTEFIRVAVLADEWLTEAFELFDAVLRAFALGFDVGSVDPRQGGS